jgi:hypothetical protein
MTASTPSATNEFSSAEHARQRAIRQVEHDAVVVMLQDEAAARSRSLRPRAATPKNYQRLLTGAVSQATSSAGL